MSLSYLAGTPSKYIESLLPEIENSYKKSKDKLVIYLEAGHFNTGFGVDDFCINSMKDAIGLGEFLVKKYDKKIKLVYGIHH